MVKITGSGNISVRTDEEHTAEDLLVNRKKIETAVSKILQHPFEMRKDYEREFMKVESIKFIRKKSLPLEAIPCTWVTLPCLMRL